MGQAKNRGSFEVRQAAAVARIEEEERLREEEEMRRARERAAQLAAQPLEVQQRVRGRRRRDNLRRAQLLGLAIGISSSIVAPQRRLSDEEQMALMRERFGLK